jgi:hypothetical protein
VGFVCFVIRGNERELRRAVAVCVALCGTQLKPYIRVVCLLLPLSLEFRILHCEDVEANGLRDTTTQGLEAGFLHARRQNANSNHTVAYLVNSGKDQMVATLDMVTQRSSERTAHMTKRMELATKLGRLFEEPEQDECTGFVNSLGPLYS